MGGVFLFSLSRTAIALGAILRIKNRPRDGGFLRLFLPLRGAEGQGQYLGVPEDAAKIMAEGGVFVAGADALVHDDTQGHHLPAQVPGHIIGHRLTHAHKDAGGAELIAVVVDVAGLDGGQVGNKEAGVEGREVDDLPGQQTMLIQEIGQAHHKARKPRHGEHEPGKTVSAVALGRIPVGLDGGLYFLIHGKHRVLRLQVNLQCGLTGRTVWQPFHDDKGHAEVITLINLTVHHEIVQLRIFQGGLIVSGDDDAHVVQAHTGAALVADEGLDDLLVDILRDGVPGVIALGHDIGNGRHQRRQVFYAGSVGTHGKSPFPYYKSQYIVKMQPWQAAFTDFLPGSGQSAAHSPP